MTKKQDLWKMTEDWLASHPEPVDKEPLAKEELKKISDRRDAARDRQLQRILDAAKAQEGHGLFFYGRMADRTHLQEAVFTGLVGLDLTDEQMTKAISQVSDAVVKNKYVYYPNFQREEMWAWITRAYIERRYGGTFTPQEGVIAANLVRMVLSTIVRVLRSST